MAVRNNERFLHENTKNYIDNIILFFENFGSRKEYSKRRQLLKEMSEQDFIDLLCSTAGIVRYGMPEITACTDGVYTMAINGGVPFGEDKEECLKLTWRVVQMFLNDTTISEQDSLIYAAITLSNGILFTHPFIDGNGRTTRLLTYSVVNGVPEADFLKNVLLCSTGVGNDKFENDKWLLDFSDYFALFDKNSFDGNQPDIIRVEDSKNDKYNGLYSVGTARAIIEHYKCDERINALLEKSLILEGNKTVLYYNDFIAKSQQLFKGEEKLNFEFQCMRIHKMKRFRGFINAMISEPPYNSQDVSKMIERCSIADPGNLDPIGTSISGKLMNEYVARNVDINSKNDFKAAALQIPLRTLYLIYLSKVNRRLTDQGNKILVGGSQEENIKIVEK